MSENFSRHLTNLIKARGIKQATLATNTNIDHSTMSRYCSGKKSPPPNHLISIAKALKVSLEELLDSQDTTTVPKASPAAFEVPVGARILVFLVAGAYEQARKVVEGTLVSVQVGQLLAVRDDEGVIQRIPWHAVQRYANPTAEAETTSEENEDDGVTQRLMRELGIVGNSPRKSSLRWSRRRT